MSNQNEIKIIYSLKIHLALQKLGFNYLTEMRNPMNKFFNCWVYEATPALLKEFDRLVSEDSYGEK